jgi:hypothetical protein
MAARVPNVERDVVRNEAQHDAGPASPCIREVCYGRQRDSAGEVIDRQKLAITFGCDLTTSYPRPPPNNPRGIEALAGDYTRPVNAGATICHLHAPDAVDDENLRTDGLSKNKIKYAKCPFQVASWEGTLLGRNSLPRIWLLRVQP